MPGSGQRGDAEPSVAGAGDPAGWPPWNVVMRAVREARGITQDGWAARLSYSSKTVQRWERGQARPDAAAEAAIVGLCEEQGLFRGYTAGPLRGHTLTEAVFRDLLTHARLSEHAAGAVPPKGDLGGLQLQAPTTSVVAPARAGVHVVWEAARRRRTEVLAGVLTLVISALVVVRITAGPHTRDAMHTATGGVTTTGPRTSAGASGSTPIALTVSIYAGTGEAGHGNGPAKLSLFSAPLGGALDHDGTFYVADAGNNRIRAITAAGSVYDVAGSGVAGYADGPSLSAQFSNPGGVAIGPDGTLYVADNGNLRLRKISLDGIVSTLAGSGLRGGADGVGGAAQFGNIANIVADRTGNLFVPDPPNNRIRKITPDGVVSTFAGTGVRGYTDGPAAAAQFDGPRVLDIDPTGSIYVTDAGNGRFRKITPQGLVSTLAGSGAVGFADGAGSHAQFGSGTKGIAVDATSTVYVMDSDNHRLRKITADGVVSTLFEFAQPDQAPVGIWVDPVGNFYFTDRDHSLIYKMTLGRNH